MGLCRHFIFLKLTFDVNFDYAVKNYPIFESAKSGQLVKYSTATFTILPRDRFFLPQN